MAIPKTICVPLRKIVPSDLSDETSLFATILVLLSSAANINRPSRVIEETQQKTVAMRFRAHGYDEGITTNRQNYFSNFLSPQRGGSHGLIYS